VTRRSVLLYLLLAGLQRLVSFVLVPFMSHALTPGEYGAAATLSTSTILLTTLVASPLELLVYRSAAREQAESSALLRTIALYLCLVVPGAFVVLGIATMLFLPNFLGATGLMWGIEIIATGLMPFATSFALPFIRSRQLLRRFVWLASFSIVVTAVSKIVLVLLLHLGVLGWVLSDLVAAALTVPVAIALAGIPGGRVTRETIDVVVRFGIPLIPHRASFWALGNLSRPVMALVSNLGQVGQLAFATNITSIAGVALAEIQNAVIPSYAADDAPLPGRETRAVVRWQVAAALVIPALVAAAIAVLGPLVVAESYWEAFPVAALLIVGQVAYGVYLIPMSYITISSDHSRFSSIASGVGAGVILAGLVVFAASGGAIAAAIVTSAGFVVMAVLAFSLALALKLEVRWRRVFADGVAIVAGSLAVALGATSLLLPPLSVASVAFAIGAVVAAWIAGVLLWSRRELRGPMGRAQGPVDAIELP